MKSLGAMLKQISGLVDGCDLTEWEESFARSVLKQSNGGAETSKLSEKQVEIVERMFNKHFAG